MAFLVRLFLIEWQNTWDWRNEGCRNGHRTQRGTLRQENRRNTEPEPEQRYQAFVWSTSPSCSLHQSSVIKPWCGGPLRLALCNPAHVVWLDTSFNGCWNFKVSLSLTPSIFHTKKLCKWMANNKSGTYIFGLFKICHIPYYVIYNKKMIDNG